MNKKDLISLVHHAGNMSIETSSGSISSVNNLLILVTAAGQITGTLLKRRMIVIRKSKLRMQFFKRREYSCKSRR